MMAWLKSLFLLITGAANEKPVEKVVEKPKEVKVAKQPKPQRSQPSVIKKESLNPKPQERSVQQNQPGEESLDGPPPASQAEARPAQTQAQGETLAPPPPPAPAAKAKQLLPPPPKKQVKKQETKQVKKVEKKIAEKKSKSPESAAPPQEASNPLSEAPAANPVNNSPQVGRNQNIQPVIRRNNQQTQQAQQRNTNQGNRPRSTAQSATTPPPSSRSVAGASSQIRPQVAKVNCKRLNNKFTLDILKGGNQKETLEKAAQGKYLHCIVGHVSQIIQGLYNKSDCKDESPNKYLDQFKRTFFPLNVKNYRREQAGLDALKKIKEERCAAQVPKNLVAFKDPSIAIQEESSILVKIPVIFGSEAPADGKLFYKITSDEFASHDILVRKYVSFKKGDKGLDITIMVLNDTYAEPKRNFKIHLTKLEGIDFPLSQVPLEGTLEDNDHVEISFKNTEVQASEGTKAFFFVNFHNPFVGKEKPKFKITLIPQSAGQSDFDHPLEKIIEHDGKATMSFAIPLIKDELDEPVENFKVQITPLHPKYKFVGPKLLDLAIHPPTNKPARAPHIAFKNKSLDLEEGSNFFVTVPFIFSEPAPADGKIHYEIIYKSASRNDLFALRRVTSFLAGSTEKSILLALFNDRYAEGTEEFEIKITKVEGIDFEIPKSPLPATIKDNDKFSVSFEKAEGTFSEANGGGIRIRFKNSVDRREHPKVQLKLTITPETASSEDFDGPLEILVTYAGFSSGTVWIPILDDTYQEGEETFTVKLESLNPILNLGAITDFKGTISRDRRDFDVPPGEDPGNFGNSNASYLFTTSTYFGKSFSDRKKYDVFCQELADESPFMAKRFQDRTWKALLSNYNPLNGEVESPKDFFNPKGEIRNLHEEVIAENGKSFYSEEHHAQGNIDESGKVFYNSTEVWTGFFPGGEIPLLNGQHNCDGWSSRSENLQVIVGDSAEANEAWAKKKIIKCNDRYLRRLYCVSQPEMPELFLEKQSVPESEELVFTFKLKEPLENSEEIFTFDVETINNTAVDGVNYESIGGTVELRPPHYTAVMKVPTLQDSENKGHRILDLKFSNVSANLRVHPNLGKRAGEIKDTTPFDSHETPKYAVVFVAGLRALKFLELDKACTEVFRRSRHNAHIKGLQWKPLVNLRGKNTSLPILNSSEPVPAYSLGQTKIGTRITDDFRGLFSKNPQSKILVSQKGYFNLTDQRGEPTRGNYATWFRGCDDLTTPDKARKAQVGGTLLRNLKTLTNFNTTQCNYSANLVCVGTPVEGGAESPSELEDAVSDFADTLKDPGDGDGDDLGDFL